MNMIFLFVFNIKTKSEKTHNCPDPFFMKWAKNRANYAILSQFHLVLKKRQPNSTNFFTVGLILLWTKYMILPTYGQSRYITPSIHSVLSVCVSGPIWMRFCDFC